MTAPQAGAMCAQFVSSAHLHKDLASYIAGMEKSSLQKAAFAALARPGKIVDLGAGSGISARDLAILFSDSHVTGVDLDPAMVNFARAHYPLENLDFTEGNAEHMTFAPDSVDAIFMSSTAHHLTSYGEGEFDVGHVKTAIKNAHAQLRHGGLFILRDFLAPTMTGDVVLELPVDDGACAGSPEELSSACFFADRFARDFRSSQHPRSGIKCHEVGPGADGWRRFRLSARDATEFLLHKDYRDHYDAEVREEYTFFTQAEYEQNMRAAGFKILHSAPIRNPWIEENRFRGKARLFALDGAPLPFPATNYVVAGEKIDAREGMSFRATDTRVTPNPNFLKVHALKDRASGHVFDVVERPGETVDVLPYFKRADRLYVLGKQGFPRPILTNGDSEEKISGIHTDGYVVEPLSFLRQGRESFFKEIETQLERRSGITADEILSKGPGKLYNYYTSPGLVSERTTSIAIPIKSRRIELALPADNYSGFTSSGVIRPLEATQLLRSAQAGSIVDARMETAVYNLLLDQKISVGPWIGDEIKLGKATRGPRATDAVQALVATHPHRAFRELAPDQFGSFLEVKSARFEELTYAGEVVAANTLEYVTPRDWGSAVMAILPVIKTRRGLLVGLEKRQLPAVQLNEGTSDLTTLPAFRVPRAVRTLDDAKAFALEALSKEMGVTARKAFELGGIYYPSKGVTPESVHPMLVEVENVGAAPIHLTWVRLADLLDNRALIKDGHLRVATLRTAHALGLLP